MKLSDELLEYIISNLMYTQKEYVILLIKGEYDKLENKIRNDLLEILAESSTEDVFNLIINLAEKEFPRSFMKNE